MEAIKQYMKRKNLTTQDVADNLTALGWPVHRNTVITWLNDAIPGYDAVKLELFSKALLFEDVRDFLVLLGLPLVDYPDNAPKLLKRLYDVLYEAQDLTVEHQAMIADILAPMIYHLKLEEAKGNGSETNP